MTEIATILRQEVERVGTISFARFMEISLYCPNSGYYERPENRIGREGDFFTSVSVGSVFGELLAIKFCDWLQEHGDKRIRIIEAGAHDGRLALDVLDFTKRYRPALFSQLEYWLIEPSTLRQTWQRETLDEFAGRIRWVADVEDLPCDEIVGIIFSNELLDAFPIHRIAWDAKGGEWFEWGVGWLDPGFVWQRMENVGLDWRCHLREEGFLVAPEVEAVLPDGFVLELCPQATRWWRRAAESLREGRLMTIDYGLTADELFRPERGTGTLRAFSRHHVNLDILADPGNQDLTAHVNFTAIRNAGEKAGLNTDSFAGQGQFLTEIAQSAWQGGRPIVPSVEMLRQFQTLTHPSHLGRSFKVLIQSKRVTG